MLALRFLTDANFLILLLPCYSLYVSLLLCGVGQIGE